MKQTPERRGRSLRSLYYDLKPIIPRPLQISLRRLLVRSKLNACSDIWPIHERAGQAPEGWKGWPEGKQFALVLTHDVDSLRGQERCLDLMNLEKGLGLRSAFYFVPGICQDCSTIFSELKKNQFEIGVHGLFHDDRLFRSRTIFQRRAAIINRFISQWQALGFRSPAMHHNLSWIHDLNILYDASTFDVDPFEPQPDGLDTIFPCVINDDSSGRKYVELPYTLPQDFTIFILLRQKNIEIWKRKLDWIAENGGMALLLTHPDYMNIERTRLAVDEYPAEFYLNLLSYIKNEYGSRCWPALPREIARFWPSQMNNRHGEPSEI